MFRLGPIAGLLMGLAVVLTSCSIGSDEPIAEPAPAAIETATVDEVVQRRTSAISLGASPGRRSGQTPLEALETVEVAAGRQLDYVRAYVQWDGEFPDQRHLAIAESGRAIHLSISARRLDGSAVAWADIADAKFGEPLFEELQAWITTLAMFDSEMSDTALFVTFHHEPDIETDFGSADDFVAAWRRIVTDLAARTDEAKPVETIWVVTGGGLREPSIEDWYPGDDVVDRIGMDVFNWFGCRGNGEPWKTVQESLSPLIAFGAKHPSKELVVAEIGTDEDDDQPGRKAAWFSELAEVLSTAAFENVTMVSFFHNQHSADTTCDWWVDSSPGAATAFGGIATSSTFGGTDAEPAVVRCATRLRVPGEITDEGLVDVDGDGVVDRAVGAQATFVGVGEESGDGQNQRIILRFPPLGTQVADGEKVELRIRLGERPDEVDASVMVGRIVAAVTFGLDAYTAEVQPITEGLLTPETPGGYYSVDVTNFISAELPNAFRLELGAAPAIDDRGDAYMIGMAEANNEADRPTLIVRSC